MELINPDFGTIFWTTIAFLIVLLILKKFAWRPILTFLKEREFSIENALQAADKARKEMSRLQIDNEKIIEKAKNESDKILRDAKDAKLAIIEEATEQAIKESNKLIAEARTSIRNEKMNAMKEIKNQVTVLSIEIAGKILHKKLSIDKEHQDLIEKSLRDIKLN
ncbi:MAG: F0F1 ATP synthase subunit B [Bacteroidales bacterium]|nr:MAG: F0F1 ATP synthase subunit B [Bacteroidales bacterium]